MYHTQKNPLKKITHAAPEISVVKGDKRRKLQKALLRYHDPKNAEILREGLKIMGRSDLIGNSKTHLVPFFKAILPSFGNAAKNTKFTAQKGRKK